MPDEVPAKPALPNDAADVAPLVRAVTDMEASPIVRAMKDLLDSPFVRAVEAVENAPAVRAMRSFEQMRAVRLLPELEKSPVVRVLKDLHRDELNLGAAAAASAAAIAAEHTRLVPTISAAAAAREAADRAFSAVEHLRSRPDYAAMRLPKIRDSVMENARANHASAFYAQLQEMIVDFERTLDPSKEVAVRLVSFGQAVQFQLDTLGYSNPSLIVFGGRLDDGSPVKLVQHVTQISVLLTSALRGNFDEPRQPIGFLSEAGIGG